MTETSDPIYATELMKTSAEGRDAEKGFEQSPCSFWSGSTYSGWSLLL